MKVITIIGTRPEIIKLSMVMKRLDEYVQHKIVHTGQNYDYELNEVFFNDLNVRKPDYFLDSAGSTLSQTIASIIEKTDEIFEKEQPDALLVLGDTNSALSTIMAKRRKIPIFHMEAGNRCFDLRVPEEINRKIVDHLSDINMPYSEQAKQNLINEGIHPAQIVKTGSPQKEILDYYEKSINKSKILSKLKLVHGKYFVASIHREENVDSPEKLEKIVESFNSITKHFKYKLILSLHPRTKIRMDEQKLKFGKNIVDLKPMGFFDYIYLQKNAYCVISDSGTIFEESSLLGFPGITIRDAHERSEAMDEGTVIMTSLEEKELFISIKVAVSQNKTNPPSVPSDYNVQQVSWKVLKAILSYKEYIDKKVWFKH
jgi:UDP-N-acetylglucosamine 2-epimerase (non-hydrolysing)